MKHVYTVNCIIKRQGIRKEYIYDIITDSALDALSIVNRRHPKDAVEVYSCIQEPKLNSLFDRSFVAYIVSYNSNNIEYIKLYCVSTFEELLTQLDNQVKGNITKLELINLNCINTK